MVIEFKCRQAWANWEFMAPRELFKELENKLAVECMVFPDNYTTYYVEGDFNFGDTWHGTYRLHRGCFITFHDSKIWFGSTVRKGEYWDAECDETVEQMRIEHLITG